MKKVLILTYYWPPSGGAGVQRWLKFVKYLRLHHWEPVVYTALNAEYPVLDPSLAKDVPEGIEVIKQPVWEPYTYYKRLIGQKKDERVVSGFLREEGGRSLAHRFSLWLRGNLFIPDARRFWIGPSIRYLAKRLREHPVDLIVSTGPPHSMHLIGRGLRRKTGIPWLADFRDPWTNIDYAGDLEMTAWAKRRHATLERRVLETADHITVVSDLMRDEFLSKTTRPVTVITNGFDPDDFNVPDEWLRRDGKFSIVHTGSINNRRSHPALWKAIATLRKELPGFDEALRIRLIGKNDVSVRESIRNEGLDDRTEWIDYLPHDRIIAEQKSAALLLLSINNYGNEEGGFFSPRATLTGKLFEYLAAERPVLMIGPVNSQAAETLRDCGAGRAAGFEDEVGIKQLLASWFHQFVKGELTISPAGIHRFSRPELTRTMAACFDSLVIK